MILTTASSVYGSVARWRRQWYAADPSRRRRLSRPVISVGNLRTGGAGKTPLVAAIARLLTEQGERPAILTRGYGRRIREDGVTVVSDGRHVLADVDTAGDEPLMLARALPGVPVLVGANRYLSGCLAERRFGASVHLLDDGFQHLALDRDVNLLVVDDDDLSDHVLPAGHLREELASARAADALLVKANYTAAAERMGRQLGVPTTFCVARTIEAPRLMKGDEPIIVPAGEAVFAVAGIAGPDRFFTDLAAAGWMVAGSLAFRDHHRFTQADVASITAKARAARAGIVLTTAKDAVRLAVCDLSGVPVAVVPLTVSIEPLDGFTTWLMDQVHRAAARGRSVSA